MVDKKVMLNRGKSYETRGSANALQARARMSNSASSFKPDVARLEVDSIVRQEAKGENE